MSVASSSLLAKEDVLLLLVMVALGKKVTDFLDIRWFGDEALPLQGARYIS